MKTSLARTSATLLLAVSTIGAAVLAAEPEDREAATLRRGDAYYHFLKARLSAMKGHPGEAVRELRQAAELAPASGDLFAESAHLLAQMGRREDAERLARRAVELEPSNPAALRVLADLSAARALGNPPDAAARVEAIRLYEKLAEDPSADVQVLQLLTNLRLLADDLPGALEAARRFAARKPGDSGGAKLLTQLLLQQGKPEEALSAILGFLAANPSADDLTRSAAELAARTGRWGEVEAAAARLVAAHPEQPGARALHAEALLRQGRAEEAARELESAVRSSKDGGRWDATLRGLLGECYLRIGRHRDAVPLLEKANEAGGADPLVRLHLASAYGAVGRLADATTLAKALAGDFPGNAAILIILGECLAQQGNVAGSVEAFSAAMDGIEERDEIGASRRDDLRLRIAGIYLSNRRTDDADRSLHALERPERPQALEVRARIALVAGRSRDAHALARKLSGGETAGIGALVEGELLLREGRSARAQAAFEEALAALGTEGRERVAAIWREAGQSERGESILRAWVGAEPESAQARFALGRYLERQGRFDEAEPELRRTFQIDPSNAQALNYLGYSLAERNERLDDALALIRRALELDEWNGAFLDSLGWAHYRRGEFDQAREPLEKASREFPNDPTILDHLGDVYEKLGQLDAAVTSWQRALEVSPENADAIRSKLSRIRGPDAKGVRERTSLPADR